VAPVEGVGSPGETSGQRLQGTGAAPERARDSRHDGESGARISRSGSRRAWRGSRAKSRGVEETARGYVRS
jgi:hypothetical protein